MQYQREATQDEVVWVFLEGEYRSARFGGELREAMAREGCPPKAILEPDLQSAEENALRQRVLGAYRGWGRNTDLFEGFPPVARWQRFRFEEGDLDRLRYVRYSYWDEISCFTGRPRSAAPVIRQGREIFEVSNAPFLEGEAFLRGGGSFPPLIAVTDGGPDIILLEGHSRATVYALAPEFFPGTACYLGLCEAKALEAWAGPPLEP